MTPLTTFFKTYPVIAFCVAMTTAYPVLASETANTGPVRECKATQLVGRYAFSQSGQLSLALGVNSPIAVAGYAELQRDGDFTGTETVSIGWLPLPAPAGVPPSVTKILFCDGAWKIVDEVNCVLEFEWTPIVGPNCKHGVALPPGAAPTSATAYVAPSGKQGYIMTTTPGTVVVGPITK